MSKSKILVTGSNGQLGKELQAVSTYHPDLEFIFLSKDDLPIHLSERVNQCFTSLKPDYCINCAAYTAVDRAESEKELAFLINGEATGVLARACSSFGTKFIHISTDYVFNGNASAPYNEDDPIEPVNIYGASKAYGEEQALHYNKESIIIRTSWVYSAFGNNFVKTMLRLMKDRDQIGVVNDQFGSPTYAADLARVITDIIRKSSWESGIYHYSNEGVITWHQFAEAIRDIAGSSCLVNQITTAEFPTAAKRPAFSVFNTEKIRQTFNVNIPGWKDSLRECIRQLNARSV